VKDGVDWLAHPVPSRNWGLRHEALHAKLVTGIIEKEHCGIWF